MIDDAVYVKRTDPTVERVAYAYKPGNDPFDGGSYDELIFEPDDSAVKVTMIGYAEKGGGFGTSVTFRISYENLAALKSGLQTLLEERDGGHQERMKRLVAKTITGFGTEAES